MPADPLPTHHPAHPVKAATRRVFFAGEGAVDAAVHDFETMEAGKVHQGPAIIESPFTTVIADSATSFERTASGSLLMRP